MIRRWKQAGLALLISASLAAAGGCQAVKGVDLGKAMEQGTSLKSVEGNGAWSIELVLGKGPYSSEQDEAMTRLLNKAQITITHTVVQDSAHMSIEGKFASSAFSVPFQANLDGQSWIVQFEGGKKPIVIGARSGTDFPSLTSLIGDQLQQQTQQISSVLTHFILRNAPNAALVEVSPVTDTVYGETLSLQKVHVELKGNELKDLMKSFLKAVAADGDGLKELIGQLYDIVVPMLKESLKAEQGAVRQDASAEMYDLQLAYLDNRTLAVEFVYTTVKQYLDKAVKELDSGAGGLDAVPDAASQLLLSDALSLKADWLLDGTNNVRKEHIELTVPIGDAETEPVAAIRISGDMELWNHNKPVAVKPAADTKNALALGGLDGADNYALLANFDASSAMYRILKDELHITRERVYLLFTQNDEYEYDSTHPFIDAGGTAMVPVRFIAERFGADVTWNDETQTVHIAETHSGANISLPVGSPVAALNGKPVQLASPATMKNDAVYVPLRFIAEALGAKLEWKDDTKIVTVTRE